MKFEDARSIDRSQRRGVTERSVYLQMVQPTASSYPVWRT